MTTYSIPRLVIAGTQSGVGKTTIVTGLLAAFRQMGLKVQSYKVGPDYIDPGYHQLASGRPAHNLDTWLVPPEAIAPIFLETAVDCDLAIIEGVMGLYDGGKNGISSTAEIAKLLHAPVILVVDGKSMGESAAALVLGFQRYDSDTQIAGAIANRLGSDSHTEIITKALENIGVALFGAIRRDQTMATPERHLGLTPVEETDSERIVAQIAAAIAKQVKLQEILEVANSALPLLYEEKKSQTSASKVRIGVAKDKAFSFYYPASLKMLERLGADLVYFSPLQDATLPEVDGLLLGGGFPEMFLAELAANQSLIAELQRAHQEKMPILAECGGFMYLTKKIVNFTGEEFPMAGLIPATSIMEGKLQTVGYVEATALTDTILGPKGSKLRGHEFHFSRFEPEDSAVL